MRGSARRRSPPDIARDARVLCLDELFVSDIADAMLLSGLFAALVAQRRHAGVHVERAAVRPVPRRAAAPAASCRRSRCIERMLRDRQRRRGRRTTACASSRRRRSTSTPRRRDVDAALAGALRGDRAATPGSAGDVLEVEGRADPVRRRGADDVVWFDFAAICDGPRGAADYVEIARDFHTVLVVGRAGASTRRSDNPARRFIALVDEFYDRGVKLVLVGRRGARRAVPRRTAALRVRPHAQPAGRDADARVPRPPAPRLGAGAAGRESLHSQPSAATGPRREACADSIELERFLPYRLSVLTNVDEQRDRRRLRAALRPHASPSGASSPCWRGTRACRPREVARADAAWTPSP